jgi:hypothetical protein
MFNDVAVFGAVGVVFSIVGYGWLPVGRRKKFLERSESFLLEELDVAL